MATLDTNLLNEFAKTVTADEQKDDGVLVYGIVTRITDDGAIVRLDGKIDNTLTPCATGVSVTVGDRVTVNIGRNQAVIIANSTTNPNPDADSKLVGAGKIIADYVDASFVKTDYLEANYVTTNYLETNYLETGQLDADYASIAELMTDYIKTTQLNAEVANLGYLTADTAVISGGLTVGQIEAQAAQIGAIGVTSLSAASAYIDDLQTNSISVNDISSATGYIGTLTTGNVSANNLIADHGVIGNLDTNYAKIDAANITTATIRDAWVNQIMVQSGLLASEGTVFYLDAIKVNAESITAGTIDVERIVVTDEVTGDKHMVTWDDTTQTWVAAKLDGDVIQDLTITADKIVAGAITADKITTQNIVGTGGWINLRNGTFNYSNATSGNGISWDGSTLTIQGNVKMSSGVSVDQAIADVEEKVATILRVDSSRGTSFKHNNINTVLSAVLYHGSDRIETISDLHSVYGNGAYLQWSWQAYNSSTWTTISNSDSRIGNDGFTLTISDSDVNIKSVFQCNLIT